MPKKDWKAPDPRDIGIRINVNQSELAAIDANAERAAVPRAIFIREAAIGYVVTGKARTVTMDAIRGSKIVGALNNVGAQIQRLVDILELGDDPRADHWRGIEGKIEDAIEQMGKALRGE